MIYVEERHHTHVLVLNDVTVNHHITSKVQRLEADLSSGRKSGNHITPFTRARNICVFGSSLRRLILKGIDVVVIDVASSARNSSRSASIRITAIYTDTWSRGHDDELIRATKAKNLGVSIPKRSNFKTSKGYSVYKLWCS